MVLITSIFLIILWITGDYIRIFVFFMVCIVQTSSLQVCHLKNDVYKFEMMLKFQRALHSRQYPTTFNLHRLAQIIAHYRALRKDVCQDCYDLMDELCDRDYYYLKIYTLVDAYLHYAVTEGGNLCET